MVTLTQFFDGPAGASQRVFWLAPVILENLENGSLVHSQKVHGILHFLQVFHFYYKTRAIDSLARTSIFWDIPIHYIIKIRILEHSQVCLNLLGITLTSSGEGLADHLDSCISGEMSLQGNLKPIFYNTTKNNMCQ